MKNFYNVVFFFVTTYFLVWITIYLVNLVKNYIDQPTSSCIPGSTKEEFLYS
ncbi:hypothetical protein CANARDRAFT_122091 [[Candida] arabinofermentans NRRL YB-2248]|uniref:Uncharacterized protein n=1 Tax=[Candida] arabinofermentans NRRL YB-2248 TaxID=983967 RepID=A0A1E4ST71_9ASCO|nr:hypothetical protein CANARDRAFT_122091 [[Candida] arabinofermentans NRRL YB-2248]